MVDTNEILQSKSKYNTLQVDYSPARYRQVENYQSLDTFYIIGRHRGTLNIIDPFGLEEIECMGCSNIKYFAVTEIGTDGCDPVVVTVDSENVIQIWDIVSGLSIASISIVNVSVQALSVYRGSQFYIVVGTSNYEVSVWDGNTASHVQTFSGHEGPVHSIIISSSVSAIEIEGDNDVASLCIASAAADSTARTWDLVKRKRLKIFDHDWEVNSLAVANKRLKRPIIATGSESGTIKLWDLNTGIGLRSLSGHLAGIRSMAIYEGFQVLLITASADHTLRVYDMISGECVAIFQGHIGEVYSVCVTGEDAPSVLSSGRDGKLIRWDLQSVISELYVTQITEGVEEVSEHIGDRNSVPVALPEIVYEPPLESEEEEEEGSLTPGGEREINQLADSEEAPDIAAEEISIPAIVEDVHDDQNLSQSRSRTVCPAPGGNDVDGRETNQSTSVVSTASMVVRRLSMALVANIIPTSSAISAKVDHSVHMATSNRQVLSGTKKSTVVPVNAVSSNISTMKTASPTPTHQAGKKQHSNKIKIESFGRSKRPQKKVSDLDYAEEVERLRKERAEKLQIKQQQIKNRRNNMDKAVDRSVLLAKKRVEEIKKYL